MYYMALSSFSLLHTQLLCHKNILLVKLKAGLSSDCWKGFFFRSQQKPVLTVLGKTHPEVWGSLAPCLVGTHYITRESPATTLTFSTGSDFELPIWIYVLTKKVDCLQFKLHDRGLQVNVFIRPEHVEYDCDSDRNLYSWCNSSSGLTHYCGYILPAGWQLTGSTEFCYYCSTSPARKQKQTSDWFCFEQETNERNLLTNAWKSVNCAISKWRVNGTWLWCSFS